MNADVTVTPFDPFSASEDELHALYDLVVTEHEELWSEDPLQPYDQWRAEVTTPVSYRRVDRWVAWDADHSAAVGVANVRLEFTETNRELADVDVYVRPDRRGSGIARALIPPAIADAETEGRTMLNTGGITDSDATSFSEKFGAERKIVERKSRMILGDVDRSMLEEWVRRAEERAKGYSLLAWDGPVPEEYLKKFVDLTMVMNTAPRDDLQMEDFVHTPDRQRENEERSLKQGYSWWTLVVRHDESDELCGYTELYFPPYSREVAWQEATAVDPVHRNKGLGRWLKATNCLRLMDEKPEVGFVDTWNAFSNGPMLGINIAMGFQIVKSFSEYQIPTESLKKRLG
jgi:GNAT superfamily N-acetyltransferase